MKMLARSVLLMELFTTCFALLVAKDQTSNASLYFGFVIVALEILALGTLKSKIGWITGWVVQILMLAYGFQIFTMFFTGAIFLGLWIAAIVVGRKGEAARAALLRASEARKEP